MFIRANLRVIKHIIFYPIRHPNNKWPSISPFKEWQYHRSLWLTPLPHTVPRCCGQEMYDYYFYLNYFGHQIGNINMLICTPYISSNRFIWNTHLYHTEPKYDFPAQNEKKTHIVIPVMPYTRVIKKMKTC